LALSSFWLFFKTKLKPCGTIDQGILAERERSVQLTSL